MATEVVVVVVVCGVWEGRGEGEEEGGVWCGGVGWGVVGRGRGEWCGQDV